MALFITNDKAENKLMALSEGKPVKECSAKNFSDLNRDLLHAFIIVCVTDNPYSNTAKDVKSVRKGKLCVIDPHSGLSGEPLLIEWAFKICDKAVIAIHPSAPNLLQDTTQIIPTPDLLTAGLGSNVEPGNNINEDWVKSVCEVIEKCAGQQPAFKDTWLQNIAELKDNTCSSILSSRLKLHVNEFPQLDLNDGCWTFQLQNFHKMAAL